MSEECHYPHSQQCLFQPEMSAIAKELEKLEREIGEMRRRRKNKRSVFRKVVKEKAELERMINNLETVVLSDTKKITELRECLRDITDGFSVPRERVEKLLGDTNDNK